MIWAWLNLQFLCFAEIEMHSSLSACVTNHCLCISMYQGLLLSQPLTFMYLAISCWSQGILMSWLLPYFCVVVGCHKLVDESDEMSGEIG